MSFVAALSKRFRHLIHELAKFGITGGIAFLITLGVTNALHGMGWLKAVAIANVVATTFAYFANRYWTFRHKDRTGLTREYVLFFVLNGIGLAITEVFIYLNHYVLAQHDTLSNNVALVIGTGVATLFRFWAYKKWVFLPPTAQPVDAHTGLPEAPRTAPEVPVAAEVPVAVANAVNNGHVRVHQHRTATDSAQAR
ncbi:MAG TPA: GtrA family protein [Streptosporangiaceae bacterium]|nr:GtrA family protein [Streptosporangiaceae bacterium]